MNETMNTATNHKNIALLTRRVLIAQGALFLLGMFFLGENEFIWYYYAGWFLLSAVANITLVVFQTIKRPNGYVGYIFFLLITPPSLGFMAFMMIIAAMGGIC